MLIGLFVSLQYRGLAGELEHSVKERVALSPVLDIVTEAEKQATIAWTQLLARNGADDVHQVMMAQDDAIEALRALIQKCEETAQALFLRPPEDPFYHVLYPIYCKCMGVVRKLHGAEKQISSITTLVNSGLLQVSADGKTARVDCSKLNPLLQFDRSDSDDGENKS